LSWDEAEDPDASNAAKNNGSVGRGAELPASLRSQGMTASSLPPDMVQFSTNKDGVSQLSFLQNGSNSIGNGGNLYGTVNSQPQQQQQQNNGSNPSREQQQMSTSDTAANGNSNMTLQLPMPTPIASFGQQQQQQDGSTANAGTNMFGQNAAFAQLLANLQQQQQQQQQQQNPSNAAPSQQQQQQQQQPNVQQQPPAPAQQQQQQVPNTNQQPAQQQQVPQMQFPFGTDPNAFLRQLQLAQLQQQLQAAQNQSQQQQQQPAQAAAAQQQQALPNAIQQQLQVHFAQAQSAAPNGNIISGVASTQVDPSGVMMGAPQVSIAAKKPSNKKPAAAPKVSSKASRPSVHSVAKASASGTVSASDTDCEVSRKIKTVTATSAASSSEAESANVKLDDLDTSNMTPQQKAKANRDRNREHARNTRLRKKAYLEKLKSTVDDLCRERDTLVSERAGAATLLVEMHNTRTEVLMSFFALRTSNEKRRKLWSSIIDESCFSCVMPVTPYRSFPASEVQVSKCLRTVMGIDGIMADTASLHVLLDSLVDRSKYPYDKINFRYTLVTEEAVVAGNQMMARWVMTTTNAVQLGSKMEVSKQGMLCCKFNSVHKITGLEIMFDVMAFMLQLKQAAGSDGFTVIPNTVQTCQRSFDKPMVVTLAEAPYTIIQVNNLWEEMTGYKADEVVGKMSCSILQPPMMDKKPVKDLMNEVRYKRPASAMLVNKTKAGENFTNFLVVYPLSTDSRITYYLGLTTYFESGKPSSTASDLEAAQKVISTESYARMTQTPAAGPQGVMMPPMMFGQLGNNMPPPSTAATLMQQRPQQSATSSGSVASFGLKRPREE